MPITNNKEGCIRMGAALRAIREQQGLTCEEVATRVGVDRQTISKIELGRWNAGSGHLWTIASALGYEWTLKKKEV